MFTVFNRCIICRLKPILAAGKLILPSTYINRTPAGGDVVHQIHGVLAEANRLRASLRHKVPDMQVYSYSTIVYPYLAENLTFYTEVGAAAARVKVIQQLMLWHTLSEVLCVLEVCLC